MRSYRTRQAISFVMTTLCALAVVFALVPLVLILFFVISKGIGALNVDFFTHMPVPVGETGGGMANAIAGTIIITGLGALVAIPVGVIGGIYVAEYRASALATAVRFAADTLNGVPSIVVGVFVYGLVVLPFKQFSAIAGGVGLGVIMIPIILRTTEELLRLVPDSLREGALALGATRARAVFTVVLPAALPGNHDRHRARARPRGGGDRAPALHLVQQPVLEHQPAPAHLVADRAGVHVRDLAVRGLAPAGVGGRARAGDRWCSRARCSPGSRRGGSSGCTSGGDVTFAVSSG